MEIRFRKKGEVQTVSGFGLPKELSVPEEYEGIDLTDYPVIFRLYGRGGRDAAAALHQQMPHVIIAYQYEWHNGYGEGILFPAGFDPARVRYYKTDQQIQREVRQQEIASLEDLARQISQTFGVNAKVNEYTSILSISPAQEVYYISCKEFLLAEWNIYIKSFEEAEQAIERARPVWRDWNERVLALYAERGYPRPGKGDVHLIYETASSPRVYVPLVGIPQRNRDKGRTYMTLEKQGGQWRYTKDVERM